MKSLMIAATIALLLLPSCSKEQTATTEGTSVEVRQADLTPEQLGEIGAKIKKQPNDAQKILAEHNLTEEAFEQAIRKVSEDPEASKRYAAAYAKAIA